MSNHNCKQLAKKVEMYLDNELPKQTSRNILSEIQSCPKCLERYSREKSFRDFIRNKINRRRVTPALVQSIKDKIRVTPT